MATGTTDKIITGFKKEVFGRSPEEVAFRADKLFPGFIVALQSLDYPFHTLIADYEKEQAIRRAERALEADIPVDHPARTESARQLAEKLYKKYPPRSQLEDPFSSEETFEEALLRFLIVIDIFGSHIEIDFDSIDKVEQIITDELEGEQ